MARTAEEKAALDTVLKRGLDEGDMEMTGLALDKGADPDLFVRLAAGRRNIDMNLYRKALAKGADAELMLYSGVERQSRIMVQVALDDGKASPNIKRKPPGAASDVPLASWACKYYHGAIFDDLMAKGMDIDTPDADGNTCLLRAVQDASVDKIDAFLRHGADPLKANKNGEFPLEQMDKIHRNFGGTHFDNSRSRIIRDMLRRIPDETGQAKSAKTPAAGFNDVATRDEVDVRKPITVVRKKPEDGGQGFKL